MVTKTNLAILLEAFAKKWSRKDKNMVTKTVTKIGHKNHIPTRWAHGPAPRIRATERTTIGATEPRIGATEHHELEPRSHETDSSVVST